MKEHFEKDGQTVTPWAPVRAKNIVSLHDVTIYGAVTWNGVDGVAGGSYQVGHGAVRTAGGRVIKMNAETLIILGLGLVRGEASHLLEEDIVCLMHNFVNIYDGAEVGNNTVLYAEDQNENGFDHELSEARLRDRV